MEDYKTQQSKLACAGSRQCRMNRHRADMKCTYKASVLGASLCLTADRVMQTQRQDQQYKHRAALAAFYWRGWLQCPKAWLRSYYQMTLSTFSTSLLTGITISACASIWRGSSSRLIPGVRCSGGSRCSQPVAQHCVIESTVRSVGAHGPIHGARRMLSNLAQRRWRSCAADK